MAKQKIGQEEWDALPDEVKREFEEFAALYANVPPAVQQGYNLQAIHQAIEAIPHMQYLDEGTHNALAARALEIMETSERHRVPYLAVNAAYHVLRQEAAARAHIREDMADTAEVSEVDKPQFQRVLREMMNLRGIESPLDKLAALVAMRPSLCTAVLAQDRGLRQEIAALDASHPIVQLAQEMGRTSGFSAKK